MKVTKNGTTIKVLTRKELNEFDQDLISVEKSWFKYIVEVPSIRKELAMEVVNNEINNDEIISEALSLGEDKNGNKFKLGDIFKNGDKELAILQYEKSMMMVVAYITKEHAVPFSDFREYDDLEIVGSVNILKDKKMFEEYVDKTESETKIDE